MCDVVICDVKVGNVLIQTNLFYHRRLKKIFEADKWNAVCVQYLAQVIVWQSTCENLKIPTQIEDLEEALQAHQDLIETISQTYAEVSFFMEQQTFHC